MSHLHSKIDMKVFLKDNNSRMKTPARCTTFMERVTSLKLWTQWDRSDMVDLIFDIGSDKHSKEMALLKITNMITNIIYLTNSTHIITFISDVFTEAAEIEFTETRR